MGETINRSGLWRTDGVDFGRFGNAMLTRSRRIENGEQVGSAVKKGLRMANAQSPEIIETIFSAASIAERIDAVARQVALARLENLLVVAILKGSFVFA